MSSNTMRALAGLAVLIPLSGCGGPAPLKLAPIEGVVKINGQPAADILVQFLPDVGPKERAISASATTDAEGRFKLVATDGTSGALVGPNKVLLADLNEERPPQGKPVTRKPRLPPHYLVLGPSTPEVEVKAEGNTPVEILVQN